MKHDNRSMSAVAACALALLAALCSGALAAEKPRAKTRVKDKDSEDVKTSKRKPHGTFDGTTFDRVLWRGGTRIPALEITTKGTLLAFAQKGGGDCHPNIAEVMRSTDGGMTWSKAKVLSPWPKMPKIDMCPYYRCSEDDGLTWSAPVRLERPGFDMMAGPCRGIQLSSGRLIVPAVAWPSAWKVDFEPYPSTIYSDDHGKTWRWGEPPLRKPGWKYRFSTETVFVELENGDVHMSVRNMGRRTMCLSRDQGETWTKPQPVPGLPQPRVHGDGCHSGLVRLTRSDEPGGDGKSRVLFSVPIGKLDKKGKTGKALHRLWTRENLMVFISYDECKTWRRTKVIRHGRIAYSNLIVFPDKSIGCIYEAHKPSWQSIRFCRFTLKWLTDGKDSIEAGKAQAAEAAKQKPANLFAPGGH